MKIFDGYLGNRPIEIILEEDNHLYILDKLSNELTLYNKEYYFEDSDFSSVKIALLNEGFRI